MADRVAASAYVVIQVYWVITAISVMVAIVTFPVALYFTRHLKWSVNGAAVVIGILIAVGYAILEIRRRRRSPGTKHPFVRRFGGANILIAVMSMFVLWPTVMELAYTAEITVSPEVVQVSQRSLVMVRVTLGGAVSDPREAAVKLMKDSKLVANLHLRSLGNGTYVALVDARSLQPGEYEIRLVYPHMYISLASATVDTKINKRAGFVVTA